MALSATGKKKQNAAAHKRAVANVPTNFIECRTLMHAWKYTTVLEHTNEDGSKSYTQGMQCLRCRTDKYQDLDKFGHIIGTRYVYPDGYLMSEGVALNVEDRAALRLRAIDINS